MLSSKETSFNKVCTHDKIEKTPKVKKDTGKKKKFVVVSEKSVGKKKENPKKICICYRRCCGRCREQYL